MQDAAETVRGYFDMWNTTDGADRARIIEQIWTPEAVSVDPMTRATGHGEIDAMVARFQAGAPGAVFSLVGEVQEHNDRLRFHWQMQDAEGVVRLSGLDCVRRADDGRIEDLAGFFDPAAA